LAFIALLDKIQNIYIIIEVIILPVCQHFLPFRKNRFCINLIHKIIDIFKGKAYICSRYFIIVLIIQEA
jgi:hypothetical protein